MNEHRFVSYAQNAEDVVLARALHPDEHPGFWIDVGAGDPLVSSVTAAFAERGWRGINIESRPDEYERLCKARPNDVNLQVALGAEPEPIDVPITTLADVVAEHAPEVVDFLKIDVEGFERSVLEGADWSTFRPRIVVIEATETNSSRSSHEEWEPILLEHGYRFAMFDGLNRFYVSAEERELLDVVRRPANVHDDFVPRNWADELDAATAATNAAAANARRYHDRLLIALDDVARLRDDLDAAQRLTTQSLRDLEDRQRTAAHARATTEQLRAEIEALRSTRLYRYTAAFRKAYGFVRRRVTRSPADRE